MKSSKLMVLAAAGTLLLAAGLMTKKSLNTASSPPPLVSKVVQPGTKFEPATTEKPRYASPELEAKYQRLRAFQGKIHVQKQATAELADRGQVYDEALAAATLQKQNIAEKIAKSNGAYQLTDAEKAVVAAADAQEMKAYSQYRVALARITNKGDSK